MSNRGTLNYFATSGASVTVMTTAGFLGGFMFYASAAAATLTIKDGANTIITWSGAAAATLNVQPPAMVACTTNITVTNSGAGTYTIFYSQRV